MLMRNGIVLVLVVLAQTGCDVELIHELQEREANEILATLSGRGLDGQKVTDAQGSKTTYTVTVGRGDAVKAWQVLREQNLPRPRGTGLGEVFGKTGLIPTATQERALMHHALAGELSRTLQSVEGILDARVHVVLPTRDPLVAPEQVQPGPKASVLLRVRGGGAPPLSQDQVKQLVAGAVKELTPQAVSVVMIRSAAGRAGAAGAADLGALARVGPFRVEAGTRGLLLVTLIAAVMLVLMLALTVLLLVRRNRRLAVQVARGGGTDVEGSLSAARLDSSMGLLGRSVSGGATRRSIAGGRDSSG